MKNVILCACLIAVAVVATGCVVPTGAPVIGGLVTANVAGPVAGVDNNVGMSRVGEAEATGIIFFSQGDASIKAAMENGGITKVHHVDNESFSVLGLYTVYKTIVYGE